MATRPKIKLNHSGIAEIAKGMQMQKVIADVAEEVAKNVRDQDIKVGDADGGSSEVELPVEVRSSVTDRARSAVIIAHPAGLAVQAKHGALTKAASEAGLEVKGG